MATLADVTAELSLLNTTSGETKQVMEKIHTLLEASAVADRAAGRNRRESAGESRAASSRVAQGAASFGNAAASVGGGLVGLGAGVAGFMAALSVGSMGLDWIGADYSGLGNAFASFSNAMENLSPAAMIALAGAATIAAKTSSLKNLYGLGMASGMVGLGAGISGFLIGLALGDVGLGWVGTDYTNLGDALASFSNAIGNLSLEAVSLIGGVAAIAVANTAFGGNPASLALSMTGIAAGIAGFLGGLVLADTGISWLMGISGASGDGLATAFDMFNKAIMVLTPASIVALGGLLAIASKFTINPATITAGMTGIGLGIAAFMGSLVLADKGISWIGAIPAGSGEGLVSTFKLFNDAIMALSPTAMTALGVLMVAAGPLGGSVAVGLPLIGVGIAGFMVALAGADTAITALATLGGGGDPGQGIRSLFTNVFEGIGAAKALQGVDLVNLGTGLVAVAGGLASFGVGSIISGLGQAISSIVAFFAGESVFDQIMSIADRADGLIKGANALEKIANALSKFASIEISNVNLDFKQLATDLGQAVPFLDALANGGDVKGSASWFGSNINFPKGLLDPTLRLDEMSDAISKVNYVLGRSSAAPVSSIAPAPLQGVPAANLQPIPVYDQQMPGIIAAITAAQTNTGGGGGGGGSSPSVIPAVHTPTLDLLDARGERR